MNKKTLFLVMLLASSAFAQEWRMTGYDHQNTGFTPSPLPTNLSLLWTYDAGTLLMSQSIIADSKVFVTSSNARLDALDENTGELLWSYKSFGAVLFSPAVSDGKVFLTSGDGNVYCLDESNGELLWSYQTRSDTLVSPIVEGNKVIVLSGTSLYAFDKSNGRVLWTFPKTPYDLSYLKRVPAIYNSNVYIISELNNKDGQVFCLDENTGEVKWSKSLGIIEDNSPYFLQYSPLTVGDGKVVFGWYDKGVYALDCYTGEVLWKKEIELGKYSRLHRSPSIGNGKVFIGAYFDDFYSLNLRTGAVEWKYEMSMGTTKPVVSNGKVIISDIGDKSLVLLDESNGEVIWTYEGDHSFYSPSVANGKIFIGASDGKVYAFGSTTPTTISILSDPPNAEAFLDGKFVGYTPATAKTNIGLHEVSIKKEGYEDWSSEVRVTDDNKKFATLLKEKPIQTQKTDDTLSVYSNPGEAGVYLDGEYIGKTPISINISAGYYSVEIAQKGYRSWVKTIQVTPGANTLRATLEPVTSTLVISSEPTNSDVYVNGEKAGKTDLSLEKGEGYYEVKIVREGYKEWTTQISLQRGQVVEINAKLVSDEQARFMGEMLILVIVVLFALTVAAVIVRKHRT